MVAEAWKNTSPVAISERLRAIFPKRRYSKIKAAVYPYVDVSAETVRRYMSGHSQSIAFVVAVSLVTQTRLEWLLTGRGERTNAMERKRIATDLSSRELVTEVLNRALGDESSFMGPNQRSGGDRDEGQPQRSEVTMTANEGSGQRPPEIESKILVDNTEHQNTQAR